MTSDDGNGQPAARRYVIVDHDGYSMEMDQRGAAIDIREMLRALPVGGRFTVTRVS